MDRLIENQIYAVEQVDVRVVAEPLAYAGQNRQAILQNWQSEIARNPSLFNGELYLAPDAELKVGVFRAGFIRSYYETLLYWRRDPQQVRPWHIFGIGVIVSAEGHLIAGRMAADNAGAGRIYFPAGSIDDSDVFDGQVDYNRNMHREVTEETGIDLGSAVAEAGFHIVTGNRSIALFRRFQFAEDSAALVAKIRQTIAAQERPELDAIISVTGAGMMGEATPSYVRAFADWHFTGDHFSGAHFTGAESA